MAQWYKNGIIGIIYGITICIWYVPYMYSIKYAYGTEHPCTYIHCSYSRVVALNECMNAAGACVHYYVATRSHSSTCELNKHSWILVIMLVLTHECKP